MNRPDASHDVPHRTGYHAEPVPGCGFENGKRVAITTPDLQEPEPSEWRIEFHERLANFLDWLSGTGNVTHAGRRAVILAHISGKGPFVTDAEAAKKLNMTPARLSQIRAEIEALWPGFTGNRRQKVQPRRNSRI